MANDLRECILSNSVKGFQSRPFYSKHGDFLSLFFKDDDHYAERVDDVLTVYRSMIGGELLGWKVKGASSILRALNRFDCIVPGPSGEISLRQLLLPGMALAREGEKLAAYKEADDATGDVKLNTREFQYS